MMKKRFVLFAASAVIAALLTGCSDMASAVGQTTAVVPQMETAAPAADETTAPKAQTSAQAEMAAPAETTGGASASSGAVTEDAAKSAALADAGVTEDQVTRIRVRKDRDDGRDIYEVEFYVDQKEYDYDIDIATGTIVSKDFDIDDDFYSADASGAAVSEEAAIDLVLGRISGAQASDVWIKLDRDDGRLVYEGEVYLNQTEYEFEIDASTGDILEWSEESIGR